MFDGRPLLTVPTVREGEEHFLSIGPMEGRFFAVIWTWRDGAIRLITARRTRCRGRAIRCAIQLNSKVARGEDRSDWRKAKSVTGKRLEKSIRADAHDLRAEPDWARAVMRPSAEGSHQSPD
jgi:hypothetical protein